MSFPLGSPALVSDLPVKSDHVQPVVNVPDRSKQFSLEKVVFTMYHPVENAKGPFLQRARP